MYYQVFIDGGYIRNAQAYLAGQANENSEYVMSDKGWEDIESDALFIGREFEDLKELKEFVKVMYNLSGKYATGREDVLRDEFVDAKLVYEKDGN